jgi:hypothetical protein
MIFVNVALRVVVSSDFGEVSLQKPQMCFMRRKFEVFTAVKMSMLVLCVTTPLSGLAGGYQCFWRKYLLYFQSELFPLAVLHQCKRHRACEISGSGLASMKMRVLWDVAPCGIVVDTDWTTGRTRFDSRQKRNGFSPSFSVQTGSVSYPASCAVDTGVLSPGLKRDRGVTLTTQPI